MVGDGVAVRLRDVVKVFGKKIRALRGVSFEVPKGVIYGILGPNGAGKTTTLRIIATLVRHDSGYVEVLGHRLPSERSLVRGRISYLPEDAGLYHRLTGWENLLYFAMIYSQTQEEARRMAKVGFKLSGLSERDIHRRASEYSKGMARRVALARALMVGAELVILDEPTSGLDVFSAYSIRKTIKNFARSSGATVLMSSHNMLEVEELCDRVILINKGSVVAEGEPAELKERAGAANLEEAFIKLVGEAS